MGYKTPVDIPKKKLKKTVKHCHNSVHTEYPSLLTCI